MTTKSRRVSSHLTKHTSRSSAHMVKKDRSSNSMLDRRSTLEDETFTLLFQKFCAKFNSWIIPDVTVVPHEPLPGGFPQIPSEILNGESQTTIKEKTLKEPYMPTLLVIFDNYEVQNVLNTVMFKHFLVDRSMLNAVRKAFQKYDTVNTLKLEHCQLTNTSLRTLKTILQKNEVIKDLSIDGNPNRFQNFYILLKNTKLRHISMRFCQINDRGTELIATQLKSPPDQTLISLNLSGNFISNKGAFALADMLRINRVLLHLNLADNWLTDDGCDALINILQMFTLKHEEIVIRRRRIIDFLLKKANLVELHKSRALQTPSDSRNLLDSLNKKNSRDPSIKTSKDSVRKSSKGHSSNSSLRKDSISKQPKKQTSTLDLQLILQAVESETEPDEHPFVKDCHAANGEIYCKGNLKLLHLNLAYNKITPLGLQKILAMLQYQRATVGHTSEGLTSITVQGNSIPQSCSEFNDITDFMQEASLRRLSSESRRNSKRKRSSLGKVSVIPYV